MNHRPGLLRGKKLKNTHTTTTALAKRVIKAIGKLDAVAKVTLGPINSTARHNRGGLRVSIGRDPSSKLMKLKCRDGYGVQTLWVRGKYKPVIKAIESLGDVQVKVNKEK